jgi:hypothetical protein
LNDLRLEKPQRFFKYARSCGFEIEKESYVEELDRWHLREEQRSAALDKTHRVRPDYFPILGIVLEYLRAPLEGRG